MAYGFTYTLPTIPGSHSNFPVGLFHTPSGRQDFPSAAIDGGASSILNGGGNLRAYTSSAKTTRLPVDVVSFVAGGTPAAEVWIKIPTAATGNTIYIEADDTETTQPAVTNAYGRNAVWSDYEAVYHLEEAANTDSGGYLDSTGNGNDGTGNSTWLSDTPGQIGNAAQNDGGSNYIDCPTTAVSTIKRLSSWMQFDSLSGNRTFGSHDGTNRLYLGTTGSNLFVGYGSGYTNSVSGGFGAGTPVKLSLAVDGSTVRVRVNGVEKTTFSASASGASTKNLYLLGRNYTDLIDKIDGWQDEVLLDTVYRSADWEATEYANQSASGAWGTVGTWADSGGGVSSHSIVGSVSVTATPAATLDRQQHPSITGDSPVTLSPAAALDHQIHPAITGDVTLTAVPAATTGFGSGYIIVGDVAVALTPAATLDHQKHPEIVGDSAVSVAPASDMEHQAHPAIQGDVALTAVPAATLVYANGDYILGNVSIGATPASTMDFQRHAGIVGDILVDITPGSALDHQIHRALIGDVSIGAVPAAAMEWTEYVPLSLSQADLDAISEAIWSRVIDTLDAEEVMKVLLSAMAGKVSGAETGTIRFRDIADTKDRIVAEVDGNGNRTSVALDVT